ncbi:MAG: dihydropteroate synthase [Candidatus Azotimanducaceae bacterium]|jgi:dihydropteroate synthase
MLQIKRPMVMGILNVTPDSFIDGGRYLGLAPALSQARLMIEQGADIIDVGGESTRPGASSVSVDEELSRVIPVIEALRAESYVPISIDTSSPDVMRAAAHAGVDMINDVRALQRDGALAMAASLGLPVCLMHMQGDPENMQQNPAYDNLVTDISAFFSERITQCFASGIPLSRIMLDPGFGFGKTVEHNLQLVNRLAEFSHLGCPLLVGLSRKSTIGKILGSVTIDRLQGSVAAAVMAFINGASVLRVHDVEPTVQALRVVRAIQGEKI